VRKTPSLFHYNQITSDCSWKALPRHLADSSTVFDRFQEWCRAGVFEQLRQIGLLQIEDEV
jgi:transposase